ncbi:ankyrin repeat domain-containing protein [Actinoplanes sp. CA-142083]|uniref:ankyrin repeat domain-containing protein n=1 Tax=Actinoplanes sp. CA-142083 TaxID=3239903 RepID=UPI003D8D642B
MEEPAIIRVARDGDLEAVRRLLTGDREAAYARGWMGETPLHAAAAGGSEVVVRVLLDAGASPRARRDNGDTPLHRAASAAIADLLVRAAREGGPDQHNEFGETPLHTTRDGGVAAALLRHGASLTARNFLGRLPLHETGVAKARVLLAAGAEVGVPDDHGHTPLHRAVWEGDAGVAALLLAAGADPAARDENGASPVHLARRRGPLAVRDLLEEALDGRSLAEASASGVRGLQVDGNGRAFGIVGHATLVRRRLGDPPHLDVGETSRREVVVATEHSRIRRLAVHPRRPLIAVAPSEAPVEFRGDDFAAVEVLAGLVDVTALAFSPDGRWLAAATDDERVLLVDVDTRAITAEVEGGERTGSVAFSPDGSLLASACVFQGGAHVRVDSVLPGGGLAPVAEVESFADVIPAVTFVTGGRGLVFVELSQPRNRPGSERALVLADPASGEVRERHAIDAGSSTFAIGNGRMVALGLDGSVVLFDGDETFSGTAESVAVDGSTGTLVVAGGEGLRLFGPGGNAYGKVIDNNRSGTAAPGR